VAPNATQQSITESENQQCKKKKAGIMNVPLWHQMPHNNPSRNMKTSNVKRKRQAQ
jgi:hypothetical protein